MTPPAASPATRAFTWAVIKLRYLVVAGWVAAAAVAFLHLPDLTQEAGGPLNLLAPSGSPALAVEQRAFATFGNSILADTAVVQRAPEGLTPAAQARVYERAREIDSKPGHALPGLIGAIPITNTLGLLPFSRERSTTAVTYLFFSPSLDLAQRYALAHRFAREYVDRPDDHLVGVTGPGPARWEQGLLMDSSLPQVEIATLALIAAIVAVAFRGVGAPLVTLLAAGVAYEIASRVVAGVAAAQGLSIPVELEPLLVVLLLAIVTDYSIFFLSGARRHLRSGVEGPEAARRTGVRFVPIILTAGLTVAASTAALLASGIGFLRALGPGLAIAVLIGLAAAVTLVPALLAIFGRALFWPSLGTDAPEAARGGGPARPGAHSWRSRLTGFLAHPIVALPVAVALVAGLLLAGRLAVEMRLGVDLVSGLPANSGAARAAAAAAKGFAPGVVGPAMVLVQAPGLASRQGDLARLEDLISRQPGIAGVIGPREQVPGVPRGVVVDGAGDAARYAVVLDTDPFGAAAIGDVRRLQRAMPDLLRESGLGGVTAGVGGPTAVAADTIDAMLGGVWRIGLAMIAVDLVLLAFFLRSLVAPFYLLGASVLALGAPLGVGTYLFQDVLRFPDISYFVPVAAGVLLVALGSDYNIFVVGRISEEMRGRGRREALQVAVPMATVAVSIAGVTLAGSFALLAIVPTAPFRAFAVMMVAGVLIDSFVVRSYLVPALVALLGSLHTWPGRKAAARAGSRQVE